MTIAAAGDGARTRWAQPPPIPYITARAGEDCAPASALAVLPGRVGLSYRAETPEDRDERGVLWARCSQNLDLFGRPSGRPRFRDVHPIRQRAAMRDLRCQFCMRPASRTALGWLFLETRPLPGEVGAGWPEGALTAQPPLCLEDARLSVRTCPHLIRRGAVSVRAQHPVPYGVLGVLYRDGPGGLTALTHHDYVAPYDRPPTRWCLASQMLRELWGCTVVDLETEAEGATEVAGA
ncbi:hypothetical protein [Streptomyces sp. NPDC003077]|uniref:hypothetical protein n=1 Tax=Streptomyces sp. NPDC003077 TaxID=3154443 RepID=UPI0033AC35FE